MDQTTQALIQLNDAADLLQQAQKTIENEGFMTMAVEGVMLQAQTSILVAMTELANRYQTVAQKSTGI